jgi:hypothetical protein
MMEEEKVVEKEENAIFLVIETKYKICKVMQNCC